MLKRNRRNNYGLMFVFSLIFFLIITLTVTLSGMTLGTLLRFRLVSMDPSNIIVINAVFSILFGVLLALLSSRIVLRPIREMMAGMNRLAKGDFQTRVELSGRFRPREFTEASERFNDMARELGSIEILRTDFINNFSHEFKTPIVSLKGFAEVLRHETLGEEQRAQYLDIIIDESNRLAVLATNVLTLSRIENQTILSGCEDFDLSELVRQAILLLEPQWAAKELELAVELEELRYFGSVDLIKQLLLNVIGNAVKFSDRGGAVEVGLSRRDDGVLLQVSDEGCGMDEETRRHIFDRFYQGDRSHATQGYGLGMAIVQRILALCGGTVHIDSRPGEGTLVEITLPARGGVHSSVTNR